MLHDVVDGCCGRVEAIGVDYVVARDDRARIVLCKGTPEEILTRYAATLAGSCPACQALAEQEYEGATTPTP